MGRSLQEQLDAGEPEPFDPEPGDSVVGEVEAISTRTGDWGPYKVITVLTEADETVNVMCWDTVCANKIEELAPSIGDSIGFRYLGEKANKSGSATYKNWSVKLARATVPLASVLDAEEGDTPGGFGADDSI